MKLMFCYEEIENNKEVVNKVEVEIFLYMVLMFRFGQFFVLFYLIDDDVYDWIILCIRVFFYKD